ncbi:MAG TPA: DUF433 domain-containing protein [Bryobacteraceae bacterium]|nr:DUF433 domain-containing protein [Bryobacteraceae bacterium]
MRNKAGRSSDGGRPVLKGTRMPADDIVENWEAGIDESAIAANFHLPIAQVKAILSYPATHQALLTGSAPGRA